MRPIGQGTSHRIPSVLNGGRERVFRPNPLSSPNYCASSLNRGRERAFIPFLRLFSIRHLSSFFLAKSIRVPRQFLGEKGESEGEEKLTDPFVNPERNVELEVILRERVGAGRLRREGGAVAEGGGALEGSCSRGFPVTSGRRGCFLPRLP